MKRKVTLIEGLAVLFLGIIVVTAFAATRPYGKTIMENINLSSTQTNKTVAFLTGGLSNPTFYVWNKENGTTAVNFTVQASYDGANWSTLALYDNSNGSMTSNPVLCKVLTANTTQIIWPVAVTHGITTPWMRATFLSNVSNATNTTNVNCYLAGLE